MVEPKDIVIGHLATIVHCYDDDVLVHSLDVENYKKNGNCITFYDVKIIGTMRFLEENNIDYVFLLSDYRIGSCFTQLTERVAARWKEEVDYYSEEREYKLSSDLSEHIGKYGKWYSIHKIYEIKRDFIAPEKDGCNCRVCKNFCFMATSDNQGDGKFTCRSCRDNPMRAYY